MARSLRAASKGRAMSETVLYEVRDRIATITLNRPERLNAINPEMESELTAALDEAEADESVHAVLLQGAGRAFCAGADSKRDEAAGVPRAMSATVDRDRLERGLKALLHIWDLRIPVVAKVHGYALGRGSQFAIICDVTFAAEDARIGAPQLPLGAGLVGVLWAWFVGPKKAKEIFLPVGSTITGREAADLGLFNAAVPADELDAYVDRYMRRLAAKPRELIVLEKLAVNRTQEIQGFRQAILQGAEIDAIGHLSEAVRDIDRQIREQGLKATIEAFRAAEPEA